MLLEDQDRSLWHADEIREGAALAARAGAAGPYSVQAQIAAENSAGTTDWARVASLYEQLMESQPGPVVQLNRAVAVAMLGGPGARPRAGGRARAARRPRRATTSSTPRARTCCAGSAARDEAAAAYARALELAGNPLERRFLERRLPSWLSA